MTSRLARWSTARVVIVVLLGVLVIDILLPPLLLMTWTIPAVLGLVLTVDNPRTARALFLLSLVLVAVVVALFVAFGGGSAGAA